MSAAIKELREKQEKLLHDAREKYDELTEDVTEERAAEIEREHDAIMAEYDRLDARADKMAAAERRTAELEEKINAPDPRRPVEDREIKPDGDERKISYRDAFMHYVRCGNEEMPADIRKVLREGRASDPIEVRAQSTTTTAGGYLVPQDLFQEVIKSMAAWGPMLDPGVTRQLVTSAGNTITIPTLDDTANEASILAENTQATGTDLVFGQKQLDAYKFTAGPVLVSEELLQDSDFDIDQLMREAFAERFGRGVNRSLTTDDGSSKPNGIVSASTLGFTEALKAAITFDGMIELFHSVDPAYRTGPNVRWMFHDSTLKALRKLKDGDSNYIWQPANVRTGEPATILDMPYSINQAMAEISGAESPEVSEKVVVFGDFSKYVVRRTREMVMKRLVERYADYFQVGFLAMARFDGELLDTAAIKHIAMPED